MDAAEYDRWTDRLSDYLDGELSAGERAALETHLAGCRGCAAALDELRAVIAAAGSLVDEPPARDLWSGIEARLGPAAVTTSPAVISLAEHRRRFSFTLPQLAAAGIAVVALSSTVVWLVTTRLGTPATPARPVAVATPTVSGAAAPQSAGAAARQPEAATSPALPLSRSPAPASEPGRVASAERPRGAAARLVRNDRAGLAEADRQYDRAVADLERLLRRARSRLRPETVQALQNSLAEIDRAIADARRALARDPANMYLNDHLAESMRLKLELLRQATALAQS